MSKVRTRYALGGFALGVVSTLGVLLAAGVWQAPQAEAAPTLGRKGFYQALDAVMDRYVDPIDRSKVLAAGLKHMVAELDPHSNYLTADERKALTKRVRAGTTGMSVMLHVDPKSDRKWLEIVAVTPKSPAAKAGLSAGDHVLRVGRTEVAQLLSNVDATAALAGPVGDAIDLQVQVRTEPKPKTIRLTMMAVPKSTVDGTLVRRGAHRYAHIRIQAFRTGTGEATKRALRGVRRAAGKAGISGIVLDLRGNPGGEVDEALVVADLFVQDGLLTRTRGRGGRILREERAHPRGTDTRTPLVVLQDRHSASAAELLSAALRENDRAKVIGERSYGKGTVQEVIGLDDGSVLTLTIARYFSPHDHVIDGVGVMPHVRVASGASPAEMLDAALDALSDKPGD